MADVASNPARSGIDNAPVPPGLRRSPALSEREVQVMLAWILSDSKNEVCGKLFIAPGTVNTHLSRIREKYSRVGRAAPTKAALLARALQDGHLTVEEIA